MHEAHVPAGDMTHTIYQDIYCGDERVTQPLTTHARTTPENTEKLPIHEILETARLRQGWTISQLSQQVKIRTDVINKYETSQLEPDVCAWHILSKTLQIRGQ